MRIKVDSVLALLITVLATIFAGAGCSSSKESGSDHISGSAYANADLASSRNFPSALDSGNVSHLEPAWSQAAAVDALDVGFVASPVVSDGVAYLQDADSNVSAMDLKTGDVLWSKASDSSTRGPNGLVVGEGVVFGATVSGLFALDAGTGEELWYTELASDESEEITMVPGYHDGLVYVSTTPAGQDGGTVGVLWALDARTGEPVWHFDTAEKGVWGNPSINFGGGITHPPAFDGEGSMYVGTGNPGPAPGTEEYPWGSSRPGPNLYTLSVLKLDEKTGEVEWYYQVTPHGVCNWDVGGPVLTEFNGRKIVVAAGRSGIVVALDQETGQLVWKRPVGRHNGHDNDGLLAMRGEYSRLKMPMAVLPGAYGGVAGQLAVNKTTVFVPVIDNVTTLDIQEGATFSSRYEGWVVALDLGSGAEKWKRHLSGPPYGPVATTNDLVFATSFDGTIYGYRAATGKRLWMKKLATATEGGIAIVDRTLLVRTGYPQQEDVQKLVAYRLGGKASGDSVAGARRDAAG